MSQKNQRRLIAADLRVTLTKVAALLDVDVRQLINKTKGTNSDD